MTEEVSHKSDCPWMNSDCAYKETHVYCPHEEHNCDCWIEKEKQTVKLSFRKEDGSKYGKLECVEMTKEQLKDIYPDLYKELFDS